MSTLLMIGILVCAVLLTLVILVQNPKGGGLDSTFGTANQLGSVQKTTDTIEKTTWYLAGVIALFVVLSVFTMNKGAAVSDTPESETDAFYQPTSTDPAITPNN